MKRSVILAIALAIISTLSVAMAGTPVSKSELPEGAVAFLNKYFAKDEIYRVEKDTERRLVEYDVDLLSGAEVDFTADGQWKDVKAARGNAVPADIVPPAIAAYVADSFKDQKIVEIKRLRGGYEVELTDGTELRLTADAKPITGRRGGGHGDGRHGRR